MEQLGINGPFLLAQIVNFIVLFLLLRQFLFPPLLRMMDERKQRIADGLADIAGVDADAAQAVRGIRVQAVLEQRLVWAGGRDGELRVVRRRAV